MSEQQEQQGEHQEITPEQNARLLLAIQLAESAIRQRTAVAVALLVVVTAVFGALITNNTPDTFGEYFCLLVATTSVASLGLYLSISTSYLEYLCKMTTYSILCANTLSKKIESNLEFVIGKKKRKLFDIGSICAVAAIGAGLFTYDMDEYARSIDEQKKAKAEAIEAKIKRADQIIKQFEEEQAKKKQPQ